MLSPTQLAICTQGAAAAVVSFSGYTTTSAGGISWTASAGSADAAVDTRITRISAGLIGVGTGAAGSTAGSLSLTNITASGTTSTGVYTVATTPAHVFGASIRINNATGCTIGEAVGTGTGAQHVVAHSNGSQWICTAIITSPP